VNLLLGLPFIAVVWGLLLPIVLLDGGGAYLALFWREPRWAGLILLNMGVLAYWLARRLSQALLLRTSGAKLRATHESP
jgi:hypothetical protein